MTAPHSKQPAAVRERIIAGVITVMARDGLARLTHRSVARAAGVSLAATTYHYAHKADMVAEASQRLLADYIDDFNRLAARCGQGGVGPSSLDELVERLVANATGRHRDRSRAWFEIIFNAARSTDGRAAACTWFDALHDSWRQLLQIWTPDPSRRQIMSSIDTVIGLTLMVHALGPLPDGGAGIWTDEDNADGAKSPLSVARAPAISSGIPTSSAQNPADAQYPPDAQNPANAPPPSGVSPSSDALSTKARQTRSRIIDATIDILMDAGSGGVGFRAIAQRTGMAQSTPSYYFETIGDLLREAEAVLFQRAKSRYRILSAEHGAHVTTASELADLTMAIFIREATEYAQASIAHYSIWLEATREPLLQPEVQHAVRDQARSWQRRVSAIGEFSTFEGYRLQAVFIGGLLRTIACGSDILELSQKRDDFLVTPTRPDP